MGGGVVSFIIYGQCPECMVMHGPFASDAQRNQFFTSVHPGKCIGEKQVPREFRKKTEFGRPATVVTEIGGFRTVTPVADRVYVRGDCSPPFPSRWSTVCYWCDGTIKEGESMHLVTIRDGQKGKACHVTCVDKLLDDLHSVDSPRQSEEPPF